MTTSATAKERQSGPGPARARLSLTLEPNERWWGGAVDDGRHMPLGPDDFHRSLGSPPPSPDDPRFGQPSGQSAPLLVSTTGRIVWSEHPFDITICDGVLTVVGEEVVSFRGGDRLRDAYLTACERFFPPSGEQPARQMFTAPQYNTWIEQPYRPTQESVLAYADSILAAGMPPGLLIIDDSWAPDYGTWHFDEGRFPDARAMVERLHGLGFSVMLWIVPFVSADSARFRELERDGLLLCDRDGRTAVRRWWNGFSALLDLSNPAAVDSLTAQLDRLVEEVGVDGFKFDAGDVRDYRSDDGTATPTTPVGQCRAWARIGLRYPFNEYRACWQMGGQALAQRLQDKPPSWGPDGIGSLVPEMLAQGMIGHAFVCPDMIGGGEIQAMRQQSMIDQEFFVRYAQVAALAPMAQFSVAPASVLDPTHLAAVAETLEVREAHLPLIMDLVAKAASTGEPVLRPMAYHADGLEDVSDQFFLGPDLFVAPVVEPGATSRRVAVPAGAWRSHDGRTVLGPAVVEVDVQLTTLPRFTRVVDDLSAR